MSEPVDECDNCGADLFYNEQHECPVTGNIVEVLPVTEGGRDD